MKNHKDFTKNPSEILTLCSLSLWAQQIEAFWSHIFQTLLHLCDFFRVPKLKVVRWYLKHKLLIQFAVPKKSWKKYFSCFSFFSGGFWNCLLLKNDLKRVDLLLHTPYRQCAVTKSDPPLRKSIFLYENHEKSKI